LTADGSSTHLHTNSTQNTEDRTYITTTRGGKKIKEKITIKNIKIKEKYNNL
jgi:hypothetical protein